MLSQVTFGGWAELHSNLCGALAASLGLNQQHQSIGGGDRLFGAGTW